MLDITHATVIPTGKRSIVDAERTLLNSKFEEVTEIVKPFKTVGTAKVPGSAQILFKAGWDDRKLSDWLYEQGPFFKSNGKLVETKLHPHAVASHRHRVLGKLYVRGPDTGVSKVGNAKVALAALKTQLEESRVRVDKLTAANTDLVDRFNRLLESMTINQILTVNHLRIK